MPQDESWSWKKLAKGPFVGKNYAKAVINLICMAVILTVCFSVYSVIKQRFGKQTPTQAVGTNTGTIITNNEDERGNSFSLFNIFNSR